MRTRANFVVCMLIYLLFMLSGCWNQTEPKDYAVADSALYDLTEDGKYKVTIEYMDFSGGSSAGQSASGGGIVSFITETAEGTSVREATAKISMTIDKKVFGGHNYVRLFSEAMAKKGIGELLDYFMRSALTDETPYMVILKGDDTNKIYTASLGLSDTIGTYYINLEKNEPETISRGIFITTLDFIKDYYREGKQPVAGTLELMESEEKTGAGAGDTSSSGSSGSEGASSSGDSNKKNKIVYQGLAAFKDLKLVGYLDGIETRAYNFLTNNMGTTYIPISLGNDTITLRVISSSAKIKTSIKDNQVSVDINVKVGTKISTFGGDQNIMDKSVQDEMEQTFNAQIKGELEAAIKKVQQEFKSDIFGFGAYFHEQHPNEWRQIKSTWDDAYFPEAVVNVSVNSVIYRVGQLTEALIEESS